MPEQIYVLILVLLLVGGLAAYFLPSAVAYRRRHRQLVAIVVLNVLAGWTFLAWVVALVWAFTTDVEEQNSVAKQERLNKNEARRSAAYQELNGYLYRVEKDGTVSAVDRGGNPVQFHNWRSFWNAAHQEEISFDNQGTKENKSEQGMISEPEPTALGNESVYHGHPYVRGRNGTIDLKLPSGKWRQFATDDDVRAYVGDIIKDLDYLWLPRIPSGGIRTVRENQRIIMFDGRTPPIDRIVCRRPVQVVDGDLKPSSSFCVINSILL